MDGFLLIDKPAGWTSFDVCARLRRLLNIKKIGHTGTLDPFATGLLVVAVGRCTKLIPFLEKAKKTYVTTILLDRTSPTLDTESETTPVEKPTVPLKKDIESLLKLNFHGKILQIPPQFSAIKIKGKKSCDVARGGGVTEIPARETEIFQTKILSYDFPKLEIELEVAAGFYVRAFARDLGNALTGGGMCEFLRRTRVGDLSVDDAESIDHVTMPIDPAFILRDLPQREIPTGRAQDFAAGRAFPFAGTSGGKFLVMVGKHALGVGEIVCGNLQPRVVL